MNVLMCGGNKAFEQRMRLMRFAQELGMELARKVERMIFEFDNFHEFAVRRSATENKTGFFELIAIRVVELEAMAMAFVDDE